MNQMTQPGSPYPLGATLDLGGVNFALVSAHAEKVELCLYAPDGKTETARINITERTHHVWHVYLPGIKAGQLYGYRVYGPFDPANGHRFNPNKLLRDPYAKAILGTVEWHDSLFGYIPGHPDKDLSFNDMDSGPYVPKCMVADTSFDWEGDTQLKIPYHQSIIYEAHVKGLTQLHPEIPGNIRGTYAGIAHPVMIGYLKKLGITAIELMPVHYFVSDKHLKDKSLTNYWGYNTLGFFAPEVKYSSATEPLAEISEFKNMVKELHKAGIEVILDVVYNHTSEGSEMGPTLSFRGIDNASYYRLCEDKRYYNDYTGTGNTLNVMNPDVLRMIMDSLRYWIQEMHIDGFRFDLAAALARELHDVDRLGSFFDNIYQDPIISQVKLIAEPWDIGEGGYQVGNFPPGWAEWNGKYRDCVRDFWRGADSVIGEFGLRLTGSPDLYLNNYRTPTASINFITSHDGYTLHDLVSYNEKHNEANGEDNKDGDNDNHSYNCGAEGPTDDPAINELRYRQKRNFLTTLFLSQGVPMLSHGDELGRTQNGNNNAYCQDNELTWINWETADKNLLTFTQKLIRLYKSHPVFSRPGWFNGRKVMGNGLHDIAWFHPGGEHMTEENWKAGFAKSLAVFLNGQGIHAVNEKGELIEDDDFYVIFNACDDTLPFKLPSEEYGNNWIKVIDTACNQCEESGDICKACDVLEVKGRSVILLKQPRGQSGRSVKKELYKPSSTYRIQLHDKFKLRDLEGMLPYLHDLGIKTLYASPVFEAASGSTHGYDIINPHRINPEIGTMEELEEIRKGMADYKIGWLQDIVPNHMAFDPHNPWLYDVLQKGKQSPYACFFDVMWRGEKGKEYIMAPFLGDTLEEEIKNNKFKIEYKDEHFVLNYSDQFYPLADHSRKKIADAVSQDNNKGLELYNTPGNITAIINEQFYRLCHWQETDHRINYRRFFTVNGLICLDSKDEQVFKEYHQFILSLLNKGIFDGLRVDHIDGLYDPVNYLQRLRHETGQGTYIIVEKILEPGENIPTQWPIQGNTGYDFLYFVNNLLTNKHAELPLTAFFHGLADDHRPVVEHLREKKAHILYNHMAGDLKNLARLFMELKLINDEKWATIDQEQLKKGIGEFLIECPVYRYYGNKMPLPDKEAAAVSNIIKQVKERDQDLVEIMDRLEQVFIRSPREDNEEYRKKAAHFYLRCMQFTGPLMAKGVEDTLMYTYNRFIAHNEVGNSPGTFGITPADFHKGMKYRQKRWPLTLNATSTHDTKRGEDVRARLNVLSDLHEEWLQTVREWQELNKGIRRNNVPDANDEYFIYQALAGTYPMPGEEAGDYKERLLQYLQKAMREAKRHSDWAKPDVAYEAGVQQFAEQLLCEDTAFNKSFKAFQEKIVDFGIVNSLVQVILKFTCPGIPDIYQGADLWDLSFVDPDNRRPVDYKKREQLLKEIEELEKSAAFFKELWKTRYQGKIKLWLIHSLLRLRKEQEEIFTKGEYIPLDTEGKYKDHVFAFARRHDKLWHIITVPLHAAVIVTQQDKAIEDIDWEDTAIIMPELPKGFADQVMTGTKVGYNGKMLVRELFRDLPFSVIRLREPDNERGAGLLVHISSLPSPYAIGDMGPEAFAFADFLHRSHQRYWQLLPLNPIEEAQGYSPYSSVSSRAGNTLLISPDVLAEWGLLDKGELSGYQQKQDGRVNFTEAARIREILFNKAWENFMGQQDNFLQEEFTAFCEKEKEWLDDFALYAVLKQHHGKAWYEWPEPFRLRDADALTRFAEEHKNEPEKVKWLQFIFNRQWLELRKYCNSINIRLVGDLPFYVSYDSADVWSHPDLFSLDEKGKIRGIAGVGPDSVSDDGQLWGMPVYNWDAMRSQQYKWWIERFRRNKELFDLVRIDHFRAFATYYEVPGGETTARNGTWKKGPGSDFFKKVKEELGDLPFIVEDLGEADKSTFRLRDEFELPGMKVLQFAFDESMPSNPYIPHHHAENFWVYTGTHDNNTTRGWYRQEGKDYHHNLNEYTARDVKDEDVHIVLSRMAYKSIAKTVILPVQDVLGLDENARMNTPASAYNNWSWRLLPGQVNGASEAQLRKWTELYDRKK